MKSPAARLIRPEEATAPANQVVTLRAALLGLFGAVVVSVLQVVARVRPQTAALPFQSVLTLFSGPILCLFLLAVANLGLRRWRPRAVLRPSELATVYGLTTVAAAIAAYDEAQYLLPMYVYPFRRTQDDAMGPFRQYIPSWLVPQDPAVVEPYFSGHDTFWRPELMAAWAVPLLCWVLWLTVLGATMWAWNVILRRRWVEHDRLSFPCLQLPMEMCREGGFGGRVSGKLFWAGFAFSALLESLDRIHARFPNVPSIELGLQATPILEAMPAPWKALAPMYLTWGTIHLGVCYLIPTDILFSGWFFYLLRKALEVWGYAQGWRELGWDARGFPYTRAQAAGSWAVIFVLLVWAERHHLKRVLASAFTRGDSGFDDEREPGSYRTAARVLLLGTAALIGFSWASGMSLHLAVAYNLFFWILTVTMTRIYAQVGPAFLELYYLDPQKTLTTVFGTIGESPRSFTAFSMMYWINRDHRGQPMAHQLSAFYLAGATGTSLRSLGRLIPAVVAVGAVAVLVTHLHWAYRVGEDTFITGGWREAGSNLAISRIREWVYTPKGPQWTEIAFMGVGGAVTWALSKLSYVFIGSPFHPIGYALAVCFAVEYNWPAFFLMWVTKSLMLRYGGRGLYLRFVPFFLGLTLGGLVVPQFWGFLAYLLEWYK
jgi:hypothetical protein